MTPKPGERPERTDRYARLYELFHSISSTLNPEVALDSIVNAAVEITGASCATLSLVDWQTETMGFRVSRGYKRPTDNIQLKVGTGITGWVAKYGQPVLAPDVSQDPRYFEITPDVRSELAVPLMSEDKLIGVVNVESIELNAFDEEDLEFLTLLAKQSAQVIRNSQIHDTLQRKVEELSSLIEISKAVVQPLSLDETLNYIVKRAADLMDARLCTIRLLSDDGEALVLKALYGGSSGVYDRASIKVQGSLTGQVVLEERPIQVLDVKEDPRYQFRRFAVAQEICSLLSVPLRARERVIGVLNINKATRHNFTEEEVELVCSFADLCAIAIENARLYEDLFNLEEQARKADRLAVVGELAVGIAHEIRNPLTVIKMIFESGGQLTEKDLEIIGDEMRRMNKIVTRFLDYAKPTEPVREKCHLNRILSNALLLLSHAREKKQIELEFDSDEKLPPVFADLAQLQQVFLNLLMNSIEALPVAGKIFAKTRLAREDSVEIQLGDNGPGLDPNVSKNLFVPFTTTKSSGLGLGLSIVKRIIDGHNGELRIDSSDRGTQITIRLPLTDQAEAGSLQDG